MNYAIIGAGNVGRALAASAVRAGHQVTLSARHPEHAQAAAAETGARGASSNAEAVDAAEIVILAVPHAAVNELLDELDGRLDGKVVVDTTNPLKPDYSGLATDGGPSAAELIQQRVPRARVVKAFNTAFASRQADPIVDGIPVDGLVAGDDEDAKRQVLDLVESIGFRAVDVGPLEMARVLEGIAWLGISYQMRTGGTWQSGWKLIEPGTLAAAA